MGGSVGQCTVGYCANENTRKNSLLRTVQQGRDLGSIGIVGPGSFRRVGHGSDVWD